MGLYEGLGDGQAQAAATVGARAGPVGAVEALSDAGQVLGGDAEALVYHLHPYHRFAPGEARLQRAGGGSPPWCGVLRPPAVHVDGDGAAGPRVLDGVVQQVDQHLLDAVRVGLGHGRSGAGLHLQDHPAGPGPGGQFGRGGPGQLRHVEGPALQVQGLRVGAGKDQQVVDQPDEAVGLALHRLQKSVTHGGVVHGASAEGLHGALDGGEGGAQLVGDVGHKVDLRLAGGPQAGGHVVEGPAQAAQLVVGANGHLLVELTPRHRPGGSRQAAQRAGDGPRQQQSHRGRQDESHRRGQEPAQAQVAEHGRKVAEGLAEVDHTHELVLDQHRQGQVHGLLVPPAPVGATGILSGQGLGHQGIVPQLLPLPVLA